MKRSRAAAGGERRGGDSDGAGGARGAGERRDLGVSCEWGGRRGADSEEAALCNAPTRRNFREDLGAHLLGSRSHMCCCR